MVSLLLSSFLFFFYADILLPLFTSVSTSLIYQRVYVPYLPTYLLSLFIVFTSLIHQHVYFSYLPTSSLLFYHHVYCPYLPARSLALFTTMFMSFINQHFYLAYLLCLLTYFLTTMFTWLTYYRVYLLIYQHVHCPLFTNMFTVPPHRGLYVEAISDKNHVEEPSAVDPESPPSPWQPGEQPQLQPLLY